MACIPTCRDRFWERNVKDVTTSQRVLQRSELFLYRGAQLHCLLLTKMSNVFVSLDGSSRNYQQNKFHVSSFCSEDPDILDFPVRRKTHLSCLI